MKKILVAYKRSKWELDLENYDDAEEVKKIYKIQNDAFDRVYESHQRQKKALEELKKALPQAHFENRRRLSWQDFGEYDCIISIGGDNHFVYVGGFVLDDTPLIGINSDPQTSVGELLNFTADEFAELAAGGLDRNRMKVEDWTRIDCEMIYPDHRRLKTVPSISEIGISNGFHDHISRYLIRINNEEWEEQKSSGLLLATGAGSTGWFRNCHWGESQEQAVFPKDARYFRLIARELRATKKYRYQHSTVAEGDMLEIVSEMDGQVCIDAHREAAFDFPPGCIARFRIAKNTLRVVKSIE